MLRKIVDHRSIVSLSVAAKVWMIGWFFYPFPQGDAILELIHLLRPAIYQKIRCPMPHCVSLHHALPYRFCCRFHTSLFYGIASLLNNLYGHGKEPFWQQAYTNLVKFIILLHKVLYDYVTLFNVYECAINSGLLKQHIEEEQSRYGFLEFFLIMSETYVALKLISRISASLHLTDNITSIIPGNMASGEYKAFQPILKDLALTEGTTHLPGR